MRRCCFIAIAAYASVLSVAPASAFAQLVGQTSQPWQGGGGYLSWVKLLVVGLVFLIWVKLADLMNSDSMAIGEDTGLKPEIWNPITVGSFLVGFFCAISIPVFFGGLPIYLIAAFAPPVTYYFMRRSEIAKNPGLAQKAAGKAKNGGVAPTPVLPQDEGPAFSFTAAGRGEEQQMNLIRARQAPEDGYGSLKILIDECIKARAEQVMMDYSRNGVALRMRIDGAWHPLPAMDRIQGDSMLVSTKFLAGLNPGERRARQSGDFRLKTPEGDKIGVSLTTAGVPTGERVQMDFVRKIKGILTPVQLGMFPDVAEKVVGFMNNQGMSIISAPPATGLTTSWQSLLLESDRITRDCVGLISAKEVDTRLENITIHQFDPEMGGTVASILKQVMLTQPDCLIVPDMLDSESMDKVLHHCQEGRSSITRMPARSAAEALLRGFAAAGDRKAFAECARVVTNQRLLRRLCETCKVPIQVNPQMIRKIGGDPRTQNSLFDQYRLPPPEQRVDEKGRPIEFPPCETCAGISFVGRIAAFEVLEVTDEVRAVLLSAKPTVELIEKAARKGGKRSIAAEAYRLALFGLTSIGEVQRVLKSG